MPCCISSYFVSYQENLNYLDWNGMKRYYLYFDHPNNAAKYFVFICALIEYIYASKIKLYHWCGILIAMTVIYSFTHSEGVFVVVILFVIATLKNKIWMKKCLDFFACYGMIIIASISACFAYSIKIPGVSYVVLLLDILGSGRFSNMFRAVQKYGITLFGQDVVFGSYQILGGYQSIYADNFTVYCMTCFGIVYILAVCILFFFSGKENRYRWKNIYVYFCYFPIF